MQRLDGRVRLRWAGQALVLALVLSAVVGLAALVLDTVSVGITIGVGAFVLVAGLGTIHALLRYRAFRFQLEDDALVIRRGVLTKVHTVVPYARVQHVDTQRDPIDRVVGLSTLVVYTAGSRGADVSVPGLPPRRADEIQAELRDLAGESEARDAV